VNEQQGIASKGSRMDELRIAEGLRWRPQETWCGARVDPECAKKRGAWRNSIRTPLKRGS
jgi:hypothetical protein